MRLNKFMALSGVASRRQCDEIIQSGKVKINAKTVTKLGVLVNPAKDLVTVGGKPVRIRGAFTYLMLNKPVGVVTTVRDPNGRKTVMDFLPESKSRLWPVGRLDYNTSGLLILTNDGDTAQKLLHPSYESNKTYLATISGTLDTRQLDHLRKGVNIGGFVTSPAEVKLTNQSARHSTYSITIHEGKNRQVRRMFNAVGSKIIELQRIKLGELKLGDLPVGKIRELTAEEIAYLQNLPSEPQGASIDK